MRTWDNYCTISIFIKNVFRVFKTLDENERQNSTWNLISSTVYFIRYVNAVILLLHTYMLIIIICTKTFLHIYIA